MADTAAGSRLRSTRPTTGSRGVALAFAASSIVTVACSTLASPDARERCQSDDECPSGLECNLDQGGVCLEPPSGRPPRSSFGFAVQDGSVDVELLGCDAPVRLDGIELVVERDDVVQDIEPFIEEWVETVDFVCQPGYEPDPDLEVCRGPLDATFTLRQGSRLARRRPTPSAVFTATEPAPLLGWSSPFDGDEYPVIAEVRPSQQIPGVPRGVFRRWLARATLGSTAQISVPSRYTCHRALSTVARTIDGALEPEVAITARMRDAVATPQTVLPDGAGPACLGPSSCGIDRACDLDALRCGLDLTDDIVATFQSDASGTATTYVYDECVDPAEEVVRELSLEATPPAASGLPSLKASTVATFVPSAVGQSPPPTQVQELCLPAWLPAHPVAVAVSGAPVEILDGAGADSPWTCCSLDCLPADGVVANVPPTTPPASCLGLESLRLEARLGQAEFDPSEDPTCAPLITDEDGILGRFQSSASGADMVGACDGAGTCTLLAASGDGAGPRDHRLSITQPRESVFRSEVVDVSIPIDADTIPAVTLRPRVQLRGIVECDPSIVGCAPAGALVTVERLRLTGDEGLGDEDADRILGPFTYSTAALSDGRFTLPVNPGVYVLTVFPAPGARGGPGRFVVVDLREDAPGVELRDGVPVLDLADPLEIEPGRTVRVSLEGFTALTRVFAYDTGTWAVQGDVPFDLNAPGTCWGEDPELGCVIRALNQGVAIYASGKTEFTVRDRGSSNCP